LWRSVAVALEVEPSRLARIDLIGLGLPDKPRDATDHTIETTRAGSTRPVTGAEMAPRVRVTPGARAKLRGHE
jgi:hypothetical protein